MAKENNSTNGAPKPPATSRPPPSSAFPEVGGDVGAEDDGWYDPTRIWTTLLTNRAYFAGLLVLHHSLRRHRSRYRLRVMVTRDVERDAEYMRAFAAAGIPVVVVGPLEPAPRGGGDGDGDGDGDGAKVNRGTWEKLAPWGFTEYEVSEFCSFWFLVF